MRGSGHKVLVAVAVAMIAVLILGILAATEVINLPGHWRATLGFQDEPPDNPCRVGLYRKSPKSPPTPPGIWRFEPETPRAVVEGSAAAIGPVIYTAGGSAPGNLHLVLAYDTRSKRWTEPTRLPTGLNHSQAVTYGGDLYLAGGYLEGADATSNFWRYNPRSNEWSKLPPMHQPRGAAASAVIGDKLYVADGAPQTFGVSNPIGPYSTLEIYDFRTGIWSAGPDAPFAVHHVSAAVLGGMLYMAGGRLADEESSDEFFRFDPAKQRWVRLPDLPLGEVSSAGIVTAAGKVVVFGGDNEFDWEEGEGWVTPTAWDFDPKTTRWQRLPDLAIERHAFGAAVAGGRIYAVGGSYCPGIKPNGPVATHTVESLPVSALDR